MPAKYSEETFRRKFYEKVGAPDGSGCCLWSGHLLHTGYGMVKVSGVPTGAHRVAWSLTHGPVPHGLCVCHKCDVKQCVNVEHLFLGTIADNNADKHAKGRDAKGPKNGRATHPESIPRGTKHWASRHPEWCARGDRHGSVTHPHRLPRGDTHYSRTNPEKLARGDRNGQRVHPERTARGERVHGSKLDEMRVREIRSLLASGESQRAVAAQYGVLQSTIGSIARRRTWRHVA